jgi:hypothetical protein
MIDLHQWLVATNSRGLSEQPEENIMSKDSKPTKKATVSEDSKPMKKGAVSDDSKPAEKRAVSNDSKPTEATIVSDDNKSTEKGAGGETPVLDFTKLMSQFRLPGVRGACGPRTEKHRSGCQSE